MKRTLIIGSLILLAGLFLYACGIIPNSNTSFVTITFGDSQKATLHAEKVTTWARLKYLLANVRLMPEALAYIPSVVQVIVVTASAADMPTPIVGVANIAATDTTTSIRIEVPNGSARQFTVEGIRGVDSQTYYRGTASADLNGLDVNLTVSMSFVGPGILVDELHSQATDTVGCGTAALPCKTIGYALTSRTSGTDAILVSAGTYTLTVGALPPTLQLNPGNALICLGANFSSVIDASSTSDDLIYGAEGASIDNCKLIPASDQTAIDDRVNARQGGIPSRIKVNGVLIDADPLGSGGALDGIILSADSLVLETTIRNTTGNGISVLGGKPSIQYVDMQDNPVGIAIDGGGPTINNVSITTGSLYGIHIATTGQPSISGSSIINYSQGISITNGNPIIMNNNITSNITGVFVGTSTGSSPVINGNNIYCNSSQNANISSTTSVDLRDNAWDRDATTIPPGPIVTLGTGCAAGTDICYSGPQPLYTPFRSAVPGGCLILP